MMVQPVKSVGQLTLDFEPSITDRFGTLREYVAYCVLSGERPAKSIAMDMDMSPSTLSRKLTPGDGDTSRFNVDDMELYMSVTGDLRPLNYIAAKFGLSDDARKHQALLRLESFVAEFGGNISAAIGAAAK